jgi:hypothetical protein
MKTKLDQQQEPVWLIGGAVIDGQYYAPGEPTPYASESEVPENLRHLIAADESELPDPIVRNLYDGTPQPEPRYTYQSTGGLRGDARQAVQGRHEADEAAEFANQPLPPETEEALQASHDLRVGKAKAQLQFGQDAIDNLHNSLGTEREPIQRFAKRGSVYVRIEKIALQPGEPIFIKHRGPSGNYEIIGHTDVDGMPPELPIISQAHALARSPPIICFSRSAWPASVLPSRLKSWTGSRIRIRS